MTYKIKYVIVTIVLLIISGFALFGIIKNMNTEKLNNDVDTSVEFITDVDDQGNNYTVTYYPEDGFCLLEIYMEESKTHSWQWADYQNTITCNYIHYQDDHYVISFKPVDGYNTKCQSVVVLSPIEGGHTHETQEYNAYMIEVGYPEEGGYGFNVYPATVTNEFAGTTSDIETVEETVVE